MSKYENIDKALLKTIGGYGPIGAGPIECHIVSSAECDSACKDMRAMVTRKVPPFRIIDRRLQALRKTESIRHLSKADGGPGWVLA